MQDIHVWSYGLHLITCKLLNVITWSTENVCRRYAREILSPVVLAVLCKIHQEGHGARASSFKGERVVCTGSEVTVLLDLVLLCMACCCTYFRG